MFAFHFPTFMIGGSSRTYTFINKPGPRKRLGKELKGLGLAYISASASQRRCNNVRPELPEVRGIKKTLPRSIR